MNTANTVNTAAGSTNTADSATGSTHTADSAAGSTNTAGSTHTADSAAGSTNTAGSAPIPGDPWKESDLLVAIQKSISHQPGVLSTARLMSFFGEHALGWMALAAAGCALDKPRQKQWLATGVGAFSAHAASVIVKRIIRRPRPHDPRITIGVGTPSKLSFPSSHATSSTAALVGTAQTIGSPLPLVGVPAMALSRLVLGVHYPTDVILGSIIGATTAGITRKVMLG